MNSIPSALLKDNEAQAKRLIDGLSGIPVPHQEAISIFDALAPVEVDFMLGDWVGRDFPTGHHLDGVLEVCHWQGKRFESEEQVHPLRFRFRNGAVKSVAPHRVFPGLGLLGPFPFLASKPVGNIFQWLLPFFATQQSAARLRAVNYRGTTSAAMLYDRLPIIDVFKKIDADTVLGAMDRKGMEKPYFFVLERVEKKSKE